MGTFLSDDATPRADTTVTHRALGVLKAGLKETCEAWVQISHSKYDTSEIICTIQVRDDWKSRGLPMDSVHEWIIEAESPARHLIRLWPRGRRRYSGASAFLELGAYELTPYPDELSADDNFQVTVELTRKGFLPTNPGRVLYFNGTIQQHGEAPPPLRWKHLGIENELFVRYTYERALAAGDEAFLQVERPCILQKRRGTSPGSIYDTIEAIKSEIGDYLLVASLISREPVKWYQIETVRVPGAREHVGLPGLLRRIATERSPSRDELPLIEYDSLREGLFQQMVTALRESPFSDAIRRSVSFEVASWTERGLENAYVLCQAALDPVPARRESVARS